MKTGYGEVKLFQAEGTAYAKIGSIRDMLGVQVAQADKHKVHLEKF